MNTEIPSTAPADDPIGTVRLAAGVPFILMWHPDTGRTWRPLQGGSALSDNEIASYNLPVIGMVPHTDLRDRLTITPKEWNDLHGRIRRLIFRHLPYCDHSHIDELSSQMWTEVQITLDRLNTLEAARVELERLRAENEQLRAYTETTRYHQQRHAEAVRELEKLRRMVTHTTRE